MYAVVKTGGKQYKVAAGEKLKVEQIPADVGAEITLDQVLAVGAGDQLKVGAPLVSGAAVKATVISHGRHDKVKIFKMRRRKHYQKHQGHRQNYTELRIDSIVAKALRRLRNRIGVQSWHRKKAAVPHGTAAIPSRSAWA
jgi:large subunit ribosomal protein L21